MYERKKRCLHFSYALHMLKCSCKSVLLYIISCPLFSLSGGWKDMWSGTYRFTHCSSAVWGLKIQHSPSICTKSKHGLKRKDFVPRKCLHKDVGNRVVCGA